MASLYILIDWHRAVIDKATTPRRQGLRWPVWTRSGLVAHLRGLTSQEADNFCQLHLNNVKKQISNLQVLCMSVEQSLRTTSHCVDILQETSCTVDEVCRFSIIVCNIMTTALLAFDGIGHDGRRQPPLVWTYLRKLYQTSLILTALSLPPGEEMMFSCAETDLSTIEQSIFCSMLGDPLS
jgi:hypothetical protein